VGPGGREAPGPTALGTSAPRLLHTGGGSRHPYLLRRHLQTNDEKGENMAREVLSIGQVRIHSGSATRDEAMREAADILQSAGAVTGAYYDAMLQREQTVSTYMGNELAIPHGTNETKGEILESALSVVRYDGGVDWDGNPVTFVVGIAGKGDEHLEILSQIAILFSDEDEVERLKTAQTPEELFGLVSAAGV
jgi:PTS system mannitol-specific IIA component